MQVYSHGGPWRKNYYWAFYLSQMDVETAISNIFLRTRRNWKYLPRFSHLKIIKVAKSRKVFSIWSSFQKISHFLTFSYIFLHLLTFAYIFLHLLTFAYIFLQTLIFLQTYIWFHYLHLLSFTYICLPIGVLRSSKSLSLTSRLKTWGTVILQTFFWWWD